MKCHCMVYKPGAMHSVSIVIVKTLKANEYMHGLTIESDNECIA